MHGRSCREHSASSRGHQLLRSFDHSTLFDHETACSLCVFCRYLPDYCTVVHRCLITPTRVVRLAPGSEISNRMLRRYHEHQDRFLRISFGDENCSTLHLGGMNSEDLIER